MDSINLLELQLTEQLLNSTLFDGRAAKELLSKDEAGAIFIRRVVAMLTSQQVDIGEAGRLIAFAAQAYAESKGQNGKKALADNILSQLDILKFSRPDPPDQNTLIQ